MICQIYQRQLLEAAGTPAVVSDPVLAAHLEGCAGCREIAELLCTEASAPVIEAPVELRRAILDRTSGSVCSGIGERLAELAAESHAGHAENERELLQDHCDDCAPCAAIAHQLVSLPKTLAQWRELPPDDHFIDDVLAATARRPFRVRRRSWSAAWQRLLLRPRLAWETAYIGTLVLCLAAGAVGTVSGSTDIERLDQLVRSEPAATWDGLRASVGRNGQRMWQESRGAWSATVGRLESELEQRYRSTAKPRHRLGRNAPALVHAASTLDWQRSGRLMAELTADVHEIANSLMTSQDIHEGETHERQP